ncbi:hypothetical protein [Amycolatopsis arida]
MLSGHWRESGGGLPREDWWAFDDAQVALLHCGHHGNPTSS